MPVTTRLWLAVGASYTDGSANFDNSAYSVSRTSERRITHPHHRSTCRFTWHRDRAVHAHYPRLIGASEAGQLDRRDVRRRGHPWCLLRRNRSYGRSEEHTSELQSL